MYLQHRVCANDASFVVQLHSITDSVTKTNAARLTCTEFIGACSTHDYQELIKPMWAQYERACDCQCLLYGHLLYML